MLACLTLTQLQSDEHCLKCGLEAELLASSIEHLIVDFSCNDGHLYMVWLGIVLDWRFRENY